MSSSASHPPPPPPPGAATSASGTNGGAAAKKKGSGGSNSSKRGIDSVLQSRGKSLQSGERLRFRLVKGPGTALTADPVDPKAPRQEFPLVAKFPESVMRPDFRGKHATARMYQQDVPKPPDDSDEEAEAAKNAANGGGKPKKRWRYVDQKQRQWVLQEQVDFLETMVARREHKSLDPRKVRIDAAMRDCCAVLCCVSLP